MYVTAKGRNRLMYTIIVDTLRAMTLNKQIISLLLYRMFNSFVHNTSTRFVVFHFELLFFFKYLYTFY